MARARRRRTPGERCGDRQRDASRHDQRAPIPHDVLCRHTAAIVTKAAVACYGKNALIAP
jgi:hypothetical protein